MKEENENPHKLTNSSEVQNHGSDENIKETYSNEITSLMETERLRMLEDPLYHATNIEDSNLVINLTSFVQEGGELVRFKFNRIHGKDENTTGESILKDGAQHYLIVIPYEVAHAAGIELERFDSDPNKNQPISTKALALCDGNGRVDFLFKTGKVENWPNLYAHFPATNVKGEYDVIKSFSVINQNIKVWSSQDFIAKRILREGNSVHAGWLMITGLVSKGYTYTSASMWTRFIVENLKKSAIDSEEDNNQAIFNYYEHAKKIHEAAVTKFGEGDDKVMKNKDFVIQVIRIWEKQRDKVGADKATEKTVEFINQIEDKDVEFIQKPKLKTGTTKIAQREARLKVLSDAFFKE